MLGGDSLGPVMTLTGPRSMTPVLVHRAAVVDHVGCVDVYHRLVVYSFRL